MGAELIKIETAASVYFVILRLINNIMDGTELKHIRRPVVVGELPQ